LKAALIVLLFSPEAVNSKLLAAFKHHHVPVTGFVINAMARHGHHFQVHGRRTQAIQVRNSGRSPV